MTRVAEQCRARQSLRHSAHREPVLRILALGARFDLVIELASLGWSHMVRVHPVGALRWVSRVATAVTLAALTAHVLELPNRLALDGALWLGVQQSLYRGWGAFFGPFEIAAVVSTWALCFAVRGRAPVFRATLVAALLLSLALLAFFSLTWPANAAIAAWSPETLPPDWPRVRLRWEAGHAAGFLLTGGALAALLLARARDRKRSGPNR